MRKEPWLDSYRKQSPFTDPGEYADMYQDLPDTPDEILRVVQNILLHKLVADHSGISLSTEQRQEQFLRSASERLARIAQVAPAPITQPWKNNEKQIGVCRDFALMYVSMLRHKGYAARMRVGFAEYLDPGQYKIDHWITEYWDESQRRWILTDAEIDEQFMDMFNVHAGTADLVHDRDFYPAGSAWKLARSGKLSSSLFRFNGHWKGFPCIRGNLLHDFQALNGMELGVFDYWDDLSRKNETKLTVEDRLLLDRIADATLHSEQDFEQFQAFFEGLPRTQQIRAKLRLLGYLADAPTASADDLKPSGAQRLAELGGDLRKRAPVVYDYIPYDVPPDSSLAALQHSHDEQFNPDSGQVIIRGARQHNLKNIDVMIPRNKFVVVTGVSGSGKSSLAFDTIYAEGQRRYVESLSSYARQFMGQMEKPQVDHILGLSPAIAIEQKTVSRNPRSTVGTVTEILDYLRVLYARVGTPHCPQCGRAVSPQNAQQITGQLAALPAGTRFQILAPISRKRKGAFTTRLRRALKDGYTRARIDGEMVDLSENIPELDKNTRHAIELVIDRLAAPDNPAAEEKAEYQRRLMDSTETALKAGEGMMIVNLGEEELVLSEHNACPVCDISFPEMTPNLFSFNTPLGMCQACNGLGIQLQVDPDLIIEHPEKSLLYGASRWYGDLSKKSSGWRLNHLRSIAEQCGVDIEQPWAELPEDFRHIVLHGSGERKFYVEYESEDGSWSGKSLQVERGIIFHINRLFRQTKSEYTRRWYMSFMGRLPCPVCQGERLCPEARFVEIDHKRMPELTSYSIEDLHRWIHQLPPKLDTEQYQIAHELVAEIEQRLGFIRNVGLHYLTLDRSAPTLSGGEGQRIRLASQIGSGLVGVMYILDEPSIGLHTRDHRALLDTLQQLRDTGNTVLCVEHDEQTMRCADWILDLGPGAGMLGGELVAAGTPEEIMANPDSLTGRYLAGELQVTAPNGHARRQPQGWMTLKGARLHNLRGLDAAFPLGTFICVTGVSGSGKSSLIAHTLTPALTRALHGAQSTPGPYDAIEGLEQINKIINITQEPIGRNPRSNPGTYAGVLPEIRKVFAETREAKSRGYNAGRFSFNSRGGRCEACAGYGYKKVEMHFLADVWVKCQECNGRRFNEQTLEITYKDHNIADVLDMDIQEALLFFDAHPGIRRILQTLHDVGLDYVKLGQSALTLSGGEAQRVKLAKELSRADTGKTFYVLDEPTTGLHFADIQRLLDVLHRLVDAGNTVLVIEHNLDVIRSADWIIDLGPEGGVNGGQIIAQGTPEDVMKEPASYTGHYLEEVLHPHNG
ncbi:MAG: excinuclease ABC subunit UvrA [Anaerolineae bacterium]|nr:excinuclease ABC subunit UvrA [Anaerolineae bacterium]